MQLAKGSTKRVLLSFLLSFLFIVSSETYCYAFQLTSPVWFPDLSVLFEWLSRSWAFFVKIEVCRAGVILARVSGRYFLGENYSCCHLWFLQERKAGERKTFSTLWMGDRQKEGEGRGWGYRNNASSRLMFFLGNSVRPRKESLINAVFSSFPAPPPSHTLTLNQTLND